MFIVRHKISRDMQTYYEKGYQPSLILKKDTDSLKMLQLKKIIINEALIAIMFFLQKISLDVIINLYIIINAKNKVKILNNIMLNISLYLKHTIICRNAIVLIVENAK